MFWCKVTNFFLINHKLSYVFFVDFYENMQFYHFFFRYLHNHTIHVDLLFFSTA